MASFAVPIPAEQPRQPVVGRDDESVIGWSAVLLDVPVRLRVPEAVSTEVRARLAPLRDSGSALPDDAPAHAMAVRRAGTGFAATTSAGVQLEGSDPSQLAIALVTAETVTRSPRLCIHAGVVTHPRGALVVPGFSGHGKTTVVAALLQAGFGYFSDEVLAVSRVDRTLAPFRRPLALADDVWPVLGLSPDSRPAAGAEGLVDPRVLGRPGMAAQVSDIVLTQRRPGPVSIVQTRDGAGVAALLPRSFNHFASPESSFRLVVSLIRHARVWVATYEQAPDLAQLLAPRFGVA